MPPSSGLDTATRRNLELTETLRGQPAPTLCSLLDNCVTAMGSRLLRHALHHPLRDPAIPAARHAAIAMLLDDDGRTLRELRQALRGFADIERIAGRIALYSARPRDLSSLRDSLQRLERTARAAGGNRRAAARRVACAPGHPGAALDLLMPRHPARTGGPDPRRRRHRSRLRRRARRTARAQRQLRRLPARARSARTRAHRHRQPQGRVQPRARLLHRSHRHANWTKVPDDYPAPADAEERRALHDARAQGLRGQGAVGTGTRAGAREAALRGSCSRPAGRPAALQQIAQAVATLDVLLALAADTAPTRNWCRPQFSSEPGMLIEGGRHPVVEEALASSPAAKASSPTTAGWRRAPACC
jgi:DNA mismatch repair protein MutS